MKVEKTYRKLGDVLESVALEARASRMPPGPERVQVEAAAQRVLAGDDSPLADIMDHFWSGPRHEAD